MKKMLKRALLIGGLLLSTTTYIQANNEFTDLISGLVPVLPIQEEDGRVFSPKERDDDDGVSSVAAKYLEQRPVDMKIVKKIAGKNEVFTFDTMDQAVDGSYILLRQSDLKSVENVQDLQSVLQKPTDVHVILDVEANSMGVLNLYSVVKTVTRDGTEMRRRILPFIKHLHLMNSAQDVKVIGRSFLYGDKYLEDVSFTGFDSVERIEDGFMLVCPQLKTVDLSSFEHLKEIGGFFMSEDKALVNLNLPTTTFFNADLTKVGDHFLRGTTSLTKVQEIAFESVKHIGEFFMRGSGVQSFNSGKFKKLKELGEGFLAKCPELVRVDVSGLKRIAPRKITETDVSAAEKEAEKARLAMHAGYRQVWSVTSDAEGLEYEAVVSEHAALKQADQAMKTIRGITQKGKEQAETKGYAEGKVVLTPAEKERMLKTKDHAKEVLLAAKADQTASESANAKVDHQIAVTQKTSEKSQAAKAYAERLKASVGKVYSLGVLKDCAKLKTNPEAICGAGGLKEALRTQLHLEYSGLEYDDGCGCF